MLGRSSDNGLSEEERLDRQEAQAKEARQEELASRLAAEGAREMGAARDGYWETISDPDISRDENDDLAPLFASELSSTFARGYFRYSDWESLKWRIEYENWMAKNEFQDQDSKLDDIDLASMGYGSKPTLTNEKARRMRQAGEAKKMMASLSIEGRGIKSGTEIHAVTRNEDGDELPADADGESGGSGGKLGKVSSWLSG